MSGGTEIVIRVATTQTDIAAIRSLFGEYAASLDFSLCFQGFDEELAGLPGDYAPPRGRLLLAEDPAGRPVGCVAVRPIGETDAEMKRLYVGPDHRGRALGARLTSAAVSFARDAGYAAIRLDTIAETMAAAEALYRAMGFVQTAPYYDNPVPGATFYALDLKKACPAQEPGGNSRNGNIA